MTLINSYVQTAQVSMTGLKQLALSKLSPTSPLRTLILSEPDELPKDEACIKSQMFVKILYAELEK
jgi:hypothetical protein